MLGMKFKPLTKRFLEKIPDHVDVSTATVVDTPYMQPEELSEG